MCLCVLENIPIARGCPWECCTVVLLCLQSSPTLHSPSSPWDHLSLRNCAGIALTNTLHLSRDAQMLIEDVKRIVHELDQGQQLSSIGVELVDNELAILYMNSKKSEVMLEPHP